MQNWVHGADLEQPLVPNVEADAHYVRIERPANAVNLE